MAEWDNAHFLTKGQDLAPTFGALASAVEQAIEQAIPASTWYGGVIQAEATPPVTGAYTWHKRCLWQKISTKRWYYYDTGMGSWNEMEDTFVLTIAPGSITTDKLDPTGSGSLTLLQRNAANTAFVWTNPTALFSAGQIPLSWLAAGVAGNVLQYSGGTWTNLDINAYVSAQIQDQIIPAQHIFDVDSAALSGQVLYFPVVGDFAIYGWVDQLLRNGKVTTNKLKLESANIGKTPKVNSDASDLDWYTADTTIRVACFNYGGVAGTAPQTATTGAARNINFTAASEQDPSNIVTLTSNQFTFASTGNYLIDAHVPVYPTTGGVSAKGHVIWRNVTDSVNLATESFRCYNGNNADYADRVRLTYVLTVTDIAKVYELQINTDANVTLHTHTAAPNVTYAEAYQRIVITKLS